MRNLFCILILSIIISCTKTVYVPAVHIEKSREVDTLVDIRLIPYRDSVMTDDTVSYLENRYAGSWAKVAGGRLTHSLNIKDTPVAVKSKAYYFFVQDSLGYPVKGDIVYKKSIPVWCLWLTGINVVLLIIFVRRYFGK